VNSRTAKALHPLRSPSRLRYEILPGMAERVVAVTQIHGLAGRRDELRALMRENEARVSGAHLYRFSATLEDPDEYLHVQEWASDADFAAHQASAAFAEYQRALFDLLARPSEMTIHRVASSVVPTPSAPVDPRAVD
jgi:quinol monooxygenase YgiN